MEDTETGTEKCQVLSTSDHYECARERSRQLIHNLNTRSSALMKKCQTLSNIYCIILYSAAQWNDTVSYNLKITVE